MADDALIALLGPLGPAQLAILRSWRRARIPALFIHQVERNDGRFVASLAHRYLPVKLSALREEATKHRLVDEMNRNRVSAVVAVGYSSLAYLHDLKDRHGLAAEIYGPNARLLDFLNSKIAQNECAAAVGLEYLATGIIPPGERAPSPPTSIAFPLVARPDNPEDFEPPFKAEVLRTPADFHALIDGFRVRRGCIVLQELRSLPNLVVHGFRSRDGLHGVMASFIVRYKFEGVTLAIEPWTVGKDLLERCRSFCDRIAIVGPYHFEFLYEESKGRAFFLDFNGRLGGTTAKVYALGYDEPLAVLEAFGRVPAGSVTFDAFSSGRAATSRVALTKAIVRLATGRFPEVDLVPKRGLQGMINMVAGFFAWKDDVILAEDWCGTTAYFYQSSIGN